MLCSKIRAMLPLLTCTASLGQLRAHCGLQWNAQGCCPLRLDTAIQVRREALIFSLLALSSFSPSISLGSELSLVTGLAAPIHDFIYFWLCWVLVAAGADL